MTHVSVGRGGWGGGREMRGLQRKSSEEYEGGFRWLRIDKLFCSFCRPPECGRSWTHKLRNVWCSSPDPGGIGHFQSHGVVEPIMQQA